MTNRIILLTICFLFSGSIQASAEALKSRYTTVYFTHREQIKDFNDRIRLNRKLNYHARKSKVTTVQDELLAKLDTIIEKAEVVLDMFPAKLHISIVLLDNRKDLAEVYFKKYGKKANHIAYCSLSEDTIYISIRNAKLTVLAHEIGHAIVDQFFKVRPPYNVHELMAQFTEKHITD